MGDHPVCHGNRTSDGRRFKASADHIAGSRVPVHLYYVCGVCSVYQGYPKRKGIACYALKKGENLIMAVLEGKKAIIIGDRDGIPGPAIAECVKTAGAEIVFSSTECFV